jgi:hypothetical protein
MILGADHLALSAVDLGRASAILEDAGLRRAFAEEAAPNAEVKAPLLERYRRLHALAFFRPEGDGLPLEVVVHAEAYAQTPAPFMPVLRARGGIGRPAATPAGHLDWAPVLAANEDLGPAERRRWDGLEAAFWLLPARAGAPTAICCVLLAAANLASELHFWETAGFKPVASVPGEWTRLRLAAPVPAWRADVIVAKGLGAPHALLDSPGFPCLACLTSDLDADMQRLAAAGGYDVTVPFEVRVNGKSLKVALCRSPGGAICELLQIRPATGTVAKTKRRS